MQFIEQYRSYVFNYNLGQDIVRDFVTSAGESPELRWAAFEHMLTSMSFASDLVAATP